MKTTTWQKYTPEQRAKYLEKDKQDRLTRAQAKRKDEQARAMLKTILRAKTPQEKREIIKSFNPYYFTFGETLNPYKEREYEVS